MEAKTKKIIVGVGLGGLALTLSILAWKKWGVNPSKKTEEQDKKEQEKAKADSKAQGLTYIPPKATEIFPLEVGHRGANVGKLQDALIKHFAARLASDNKPTNFFGSKTDAAVKDIGYTVPVIESDYNRILAGKYPASKGTITNNIQNQTFELKTGKTGFSKYGGVAIYKYGNGKLDHYAAKGEELGTISEIQSDSVAVGKDQFTKTYFVRNKDYVAVVA